MKITSFSLNNFAPEEFFGGGGGGQIRVDERSKTLECDRTMKAFSFVERNYLCFKKEALIVQETFLNWYVNVDKKYFYTLSFYVTSSKYSYKKAQ